jgi:hypothetical protein
MEKDRDTKQMMRSTPILLATILILVVTQAICMASDSSEKGRTRGSVPIEFSEIVFIVPEIDENRKKLDQIIVELEKLHQDDFGNRLYTRRAVSEIDKANLVFYFENMYLAMVVWIDPASRASYCRNGIEMLAYYNGRATEIAKSIRSMKIRIDDTDIQKKITAAGEIIDACVKSFDSGISILESALASYTS